MKTTFSFPGIWILAILAAALVLASSCKEAAPDSDPNLSDADLISGKWLALSWTEDGSPLIPDRYKSLTLKFDDFNNNEGKYRYDLTYNSPDTLLISEGRCMINAEKKELFLIGDDHRYTYDLSGSNLLLEATVTQKTWQLALRKEQ